MDKKELILRKLSTISLNNKIVELNNIIEAQNEKNATTYDKSKQLLTELMQTIKKLKNEGLSISEISKITDTTTIAVKQQLSRARKQLRELLKEDFVK